MSVGTTMAHVHAESIPTPRPARRRRARWPVAYVAPAVIALGVTFGYSFVEVVRYSFYAGSLGALTYVGGANYTAIFQDPQFTHSLLDNLKLLITVPVITLLALGVALVINTGLRGWRAYRAIIFLPYILPATAMGLAFSYLLQGGGVLDSLLRDAGMSFLIHDWLGSPSWVLFSIGGVIVWQQLGFGVVVFSAALLNVPAEIIEAARLDGAGWWRIQVSVMVPYIKRIIEFFVILEAIAALSSVFTYVYVLTGAGPAYSSSVMEFYIYQNGFENGAIGVASAAAVVLLAIASALIAIFLWVRTRASKDRA
ncbi:MAG: sugar ABC transporter permease [Actinomycetota bacterium]|nr:sugar ABC transporter permease [Actinomycetota bacterium]